MPSRPTCRGVQQMAQPGLDCSQVRTDPTLTDAREHYEKST
jgi:hypothetical protein